MTDRQEPSMLAIKRDFGTPVLMELVLRHVIKGMNIAGADLTNDQIEFLVTDVIMADYSSYRISDLNLITKKIASTKSYGQIKLQDVIMAIEEYSYERDEFAVKMNVKKHSALKGTPITSDKMLEIYEKMVKEAKEPKLTQKEIDANNRAVNEEKIKRLEEIEGKSFRK